MPKFPEKISISGVGVSSCTVAEALASAAETLREQAQCSIFSPNPEMAVEAASNDLFRVALSTCELALMDGFGLMLAAKLRRKRVPQRIAGTDFFIQLMELAEQEVLPVFLLGGVENRAMESADALLRRFPKLKVVGARSGGKIRDDGSGDQDAATVAAIRASGARILIVAFGAPKQELWITRQRVNLPQVGVLMGVGGAFDFITGATRRAPLGMRRLGLEWLYRLIRQPWRIARVFRAIVVFWWIVLRSQVSERRTQNAERRTQN